VNLCLAGNARNLASRERLASTIDELRRNKGWSIVLRGHDLRLRDAPRDLVKEQPKLTLRVLVTKNSGKICQLRAVRPAAITLFLDSTLSPKAIVSLAHKHGMKSAALTDIGNLHGAVEFAQAAKHAGIKPIFGTSFALVRNRYCCLSNPSTAITI